MGQLAWRNPRGPRVTPSGTNEPFLGSGIPNQNFQLVTIASWIWSYGVSLASWRFVPIYNLLGGSSRTSSLFFAPLVSPKIHHEVPHDLTTALEIVSQELVTLMSWV